MSYNGWTNKETWLVNLWLGDYFLECAEYGDCIDRDYIESMIEEMFSSQFAAPDCVGLITDLLNCALGSINYHELEEHYKLELE